MANEATVSCSLLIRKGNLQYRADPTQYRADVLEGTGPTPGEVVVTSQGKNIDLSQIATPGLCRIHNRSDTEFVLVGIHDGVHFFPMLELLPSEAFVGRLYRDLGEEFTGTGTGTPSTTVHLHLKTTTANSARVLVEVFGK